MKPWTNKEVARLRELFPDAPWSDLARELHPRTPASIVKMAQKIGVRRSAAANSRTRNWMEVASNHQPLVFWGPKQ